MPTIEISDEDLKFLQDLAHEMATQDNRATGQPYYYCVQQVKRIVGMDPGISDESVFVGGDDYEEFKTKEEAIESFMAVDGMSEEAAETHFKENFSEFGVLETTVDSNFFLTLKGFKEHMRLNAHNYPGKQDGDNYKDSEKVYSYVQSAWRNPEVRTLYGVIARLGGAKDSE